MLSDDKNARGSDHRAHQNQNNHWHDEKINGCTEIFNLSVMLSPHTITTSMNLQFLDKTYRIHMAHFEDKAVLYCSRYDNVHHVSRKSQIFIRHYELKFCSLLYLCFHIL